jgi:predicted nucleic acid-binding protein
MSAVLVDSNVLLDVVTNDPHWYDWSSQAIARAEEIGKLVINPIILAEVSIGYLNIEDVNDAVPLDQFVREPISDDAAFLAGKAFVLYRRRGGTRRSPLPDFFIGAHAAVAGYRLLTRDPSRFLSYFPKLVVIAP